MKKLSVSICVYLWTKIFAFGSLQAGRLRSRLTVGDETAEFDLFAFGGGSDEKGGAALGKSWKLEIYFGDAVDVSAGCP